MANAEMAAIREMLAASPRPASLEDRRKRLDALGSQHIVPIDVIMEPADADGVPAERPVANFWR